ncbi:MAG: hypothetical protein AAB728_01460 [Patescibacteria group bacterium]
MHHRFRTLFLASVLVGLLAAVPFLLTGEQRGTLVAPAADRLPGIVDDSSPQFHMTGKGWKTGTLGGYGTTHTLHAATMAQGDASACWTAPALAAGAYRVYATWPQDEAPGTVTYTVEEGKGILLSREADQGTDPQGEVWEWTPWQLLGEVALAKGKDVRLCVNATNGVKFAADAVRFVDADRAQRDTVPFPSGTFLAGEGSHPDGEEGCAIRCAAPDRCALVCGERKYTRKEGGVEGRYDLVRGDAGTLWTFEDVNPGEYGLYVTWPANVAKSIALAEHLAFEAMEKGANKHALGTFTLAVDALTKAPEGPAWEGMQWKELGTVRIGKGEAVQVTLEPPVVPSSPKDITTFAYPADAVVLVPTVPLPAFPPASAITVDDGEARFSLASPRYWESRPGGYGFGHKVLQAQRAGTGEEATWSFGDVRPGGYDIFATWPPAASAGERGTYRMKEQGYSDSPLPPVLTSAHPRGPLQGERTRWQRLGAVEVQGGKNVRVTMDGGVADAVALVPEGAADVPLALRVALEREGKGSVQAGTDLVYNVALFNESSTRLARGVVLHARSPKELAFNRKGGSKECDARDGEVLCDLGTIAPRTTANVRITFAVPSYGACNAALVQQAEVRLQSGESFLSTELRDIVSCAPSSTARPTAPKPPADGPDLILAGTGSASVLPGGHTSYTLTAKNTGNAEAPKVVVSDFIPDWLTFVPEASDVSCVQEADVVYCRGADRKTGFPLAPGEEKTFRISFAVPPTAKCESVIANTASAQDMDGAEGDTENNGSIAMTRVVCPPPPPTPLTVTVRREGDAPVRRGSPLTYAVSVKNDSEARETGELTMVLPLPRNLTFLAEETSDACRTENEGMVCVLPSLKPGKKAAVKIAALAARGADSCGKPIILEADVSAGGTPAARGAAPIHGIDCPSADLAVGLAQRAPSLTAPGKGVHYTLTLRNDGPEAALGASVSIPLPSGLTLRAESTHPLCSVQDSAIHCGRGKDGQGIVLQPGDKRTFPIAVDVAADRACGDTLTLRATAHQNLSRDPLLANDWAEARTPVECLGVEERTQQADTAPVSPGKSVSYVTTVGNTSRLLEAAGVEVEFFPPLGFALLAEESDRSCTMEAGRLLCDIGSLPPGTSRRLQTTFTVASSMPCGSHIELGTQVRTERMKTLPKQALGADVWCPAADLSVSLTGSSSVFQGASVPLTLTVMNRGPQPAEGVRATLALPEELSLSPAQSDAGCRQAEGKVTCNGGSAQGFTLNVDEARTLRITVIAAAGTLCNKTLRGEGSAESRTHDARREDNAKAHNLRIQCQGVDLALSRTASAAARPSQPFSVNYRIVNRGPEAALHVNLRSSLPGGVTFDPSQSTEGCRQVGSNVFCTGETLEGFTMRKDDEREFTVAYVVPASAACGSNLRVEGEVLTGSREKGEEDNAAAADIPVQCDVQGAGRALVDLSVQLASPSPYPTPGKTSQFGIAARNAGLDTAKDVSLVLTVPSGFRLDPSAVPPGCVQTSPTEITCGALSISVEGGREAGFVIGQGQTIRFTIPVIAPPAEQLKCGDPVRTAVRVRTASLDTNPLNDATQGTFPAFCPYDPFKAQ